MMAKPQYGQPIVQRVFVSNNPQYGQPIVVKRED